ncbi:hypothetical protein COCNU_scaffold005294G000010 [Cocos nucifera]|nr:hypothetical protein [Cocos nucifera]
MLVANTSYTSFHHPLAATPRRLSHPLSSSLPCPIPHAPPNSPDPLVRTRNNTTKPSNQTRSISMRIRGSKTPPLNSSSSALAVTPTPSLSPPSNSSCSNDPSSRCEGLDLLVLAVIEVNGDRALDAERNAINGVKEEDDRTEKRKEEKGSEFEVGSKPNKRRRQLAMPSRYQDSVLQPWKRRRRRRPIGAKRSG